MKRKIVFLTGTRADFGKLKSLIEILLTREEFEIHLFATGMHLDHKFGYTVHEIEKCGYRNIHTFSNHDKESLMDQTLAKTIEGFGSLVRSLQPDLIVVHGDRIEALAGASVGALNNVLVAHIEGGELSGTVDELIRHAVSKLSHIHFVANEEAFARLVQMGELASSIFIIGSPDMDIILSDKLPSLGEAKKRYEIPFDSYGISLFHPVTTESDQMEKYASDYFTALDNSSLNFVMLYPNNDKGSETIMNELKKRELNDRYRIFPSIRFEYFLSLLKSAAFIIGNSSAGIREAPYYGVPTVNVGTRQHRRSRNPEIIHTGYSVQAVSRGIETAVRKQTVPQQLFGSGNSDLYFLEILTSGTFWEISKQKSFSDYITT